MTTSVVLLMAYGYAASPIAIPPAAARAGPPRLCSTRSAPPAPPPHATHRRGGGGGDDGLLLASMSVEERRALVALWKWDYETSKTIHDEDAKAAVFVANWADDQQPWLSMLQPRSWRAGFGAGSTEAVIVTRYELDSSHWRRALVGTCMLHGCGSSTRFPFSLYPARWLSLTATPLLCFPFCLAGKHVLVVDQILLSPSVPTHLRGAVHAAIVQAFVLYGQFHAQNVRYQDHLHDFGI
jgi:hypothetical protein